MDSTVQQFHFQQGDDVVGANGDKVGTVQSVGPNHLVVAKGFLFPTDYYIPFSAVDRYDSERGVVHLSIGRDEAMGSGWETPPDTGNREFTSPAARDFGRAVSDNTGGGLATSGAPMGASAAAGLSDAGTGGSLSNAGAMGVAGGTTTGEATLTGTGMAGAGDPAATNPMSAGAAPTDPNAMHQGAETMSGQNMSTGGAQNEAQRIDADYAGDPAARRGALGDDVTDTSDQGGNRGDNPVVNPTDPERLEDDSLTRGAVSDPDPANAMVDSTAVGAVGTPFYLGSMDDVPQNAPTGNLNMDTAVDSVLQNPDEQRTLMTTRDPDKDESR
jgi:hypothetical protein